jgi:AraC family transcriptional regulator, transcriptional activator of pobA
MALLPQNIPVKNKLDAGTPFKVSPMKEVIKPTVPHRHAGYHELILLSQGAGFHEIDGLSSEITPPVAYYLRPGQTHRWNFTAIPKGYVILFREELLLKQDINAFFEFPSLVPLQQPDIFFQLAAIIHQEYTRQTYAANTVQAYIHLLVSKLQQSVVQYKSGPRPANSLFQQFKQMVNTYFATRKDLAFYAANLHITTAVLNKTCKKVMDKTPGAVINERVLLEAKLLLAATEKPINDIAIELGFTDSPHFIKFFKQHTHLTPRSYREMAVTGK